MNIDTQNCTTCKYSDGNYCFFSPPQIVSTKRADSFTYEIFNERYQSVFPKIDKSTRCYQWKDKNLDTENQKTSIQ